MIPKNKICKAITKYATNVYRQIFKFSQIP